MNLLIITILAQSIAPIQNQPSGIASEMVQIQLVQMGWLGLTHGAFSQPVDVAYKAIDEIPSWIRRPFARNFGLLLDQFQSAPSLLMKLGYTNSTRPERVLQPLNGYPQSPNGCGEQAAGMWLRAYGNPMMLNDLDTQQIFFGGGSGFLTMEMLRRGYFAVTATTMDINVIQSYIAAGLSPIESVRNSDGGLHYVTYTGYSPHRTYTVNNGGFLDPTWNFNGSTSREMMFTTVALPQKSALVAELANSLSLRRANSNQIYEGVSLSDFFIDPAKGFYFGELAYKLNYRGYTLTVRGNGAYAEYLSNSGKRTNKMPALSSAKGFGWGGSVLLNLRFGKDFQIDYGMERTTGDTRSKQPITDVLAIRFHNVSLLASVDSQLNVQGALEYNMNGVKVGVNASYATSGLTPWLFVSTYLEVLDW
jgi:hypothetical protein